MDKDKALNFNERRDEKTQERKEIILYLLYIFKD